MEHADHLITQTVHDRKGDADDIGISLIIEMEVFNVDLTRAFVESAFPPGAVGMDKAGCCRQSGKEMSFHICHEQLLCGGADDLGQEEVGFVL